MTQIQVIFEATIGHVTDLVEATPAVGRAWQEYTAAFSAVNEALAGAGHRPLALDMEAAVNAYASELVRAAFLAGLAFDGRALLLDVANK